MSDELPPLPKVRQFDGYDWLSTKTSRRDLPHWELKGSTYFITIKVDRLLGYPFYDHQAAHTMTSALWRGDKEGLYQLHAYVVMPDHVHFIIKPLSDITLSKIMHQLKGSTAFQINKLLKRSGKFWQSECFDHLIRDGNYLREIWEYIKENPVKAKLVPKAEDYPFSSFYDPS